LRAELPAAIDLQKACRGRAWQRNCRFFDVEGPMACEHENCRCDETPVEQAGKSFCSETCAEADGDSEREARCACGHADCAAL
jgi:hypothetical protein